jgi:UDP-N-acetylglucosamine diphosphorylase/glucosamine-1-phosphate N-acetyltransferase
MHACLFEDRGALGLAPLSLTRPVFDLLCGTSTLAEQQFRTCPRAELGVLVRPELVDCVRIDRPNVAINDRRWLRSGPLALINGRWLPPLPHRPIPTEQPCVGIVGGSVAFAFVTPELLPAEPIGGFDDCLERLKKTLPPVPAGGVVVNHLWELIHANTARLCAEFDCRTAAEEDDTVGWRPAGCAVVGPADKLVVDPLAQVDPMVVFDTTRGPITVEGNAVVTAFSRIEGPCHIGAGTHVLGAKIRPGTTLGPCCRIGGEIECSIVQGFTNKYHEGFLGHSYVGAWVNLGAGSQVSDLRNDYGEVMVPIGGVATATGESKVGGLIGDHAKIGIGSLLNTGTIIGAFGQALPAGRLLPKYVPPFCSTAFDRIVEQTELDSLLTTSATVMARRGRALTPAHENLYRTMFAATAPERRRALRDVQRQRLRKVA